MNACTHDAHPKTHVFTCFMLTTYRLISDQYERDGREKPFEESVRKLSEENLSQKNTIFDLRSQIKDLEVSFQYCFNFFSQYFFLKLM